MPPPLVGDLDGNQRIDRHDALLFSQQFGQNAQADELSGDFDGDGHVTLADLANLQSRLGDFFGMSPKGSAAPVPEPPAIQFIAVMSFTVGLVLVRKGQCPCGAP
jgi:hypothetical protein